MPEVAKILDRLSPPTPADALTVKTSTGKYGLTHTDGSRTVGTYVDPSGGWFGTKSNDPLLFFTNDGGPSVTLATNGNLGVGVTSPSAKLDVNGKIGTQHVGDFRRTDQMEAEVRPIEPV